LSQKAGPRKKLRSNFNEATLFCVAEFYVVK
jgi:hypothetical protein